MGGSGGIHSGSFPDGIVGVMRHNLKENWATMVMATVGVPIAFKVGTKLLRKPIIQPMNKMIKMAGFSSEVKV